MSLLVFPFFFYVVRHLCIFLLCNFYYSILHLYNIVIPNKNLVKSVNLKNAGLAGWDILWKGFQIHVVISFAVVYCISSPPSHFHCFPSTATFLSCFVAEIPNLSMSSLNMHDLPAKNQWTWTKTATLYWTMKAAGYWTYMITLRASDLKSHAS